VVYQHYAVPTAGGFENGTFQKVLSFKFLVLS
jgi:hypothetical protein